MPQKNITIPPEIKKIQTRIQTVIGHPLDPTWNKNTEVWELRYVNRSGVRIFDVVCRHDGKRWSVAVITQVLCMGDIIEA